MTDKRGIVHEPDSEYRKTQAVNSSLLKCLKKQSPAHGQLIWENRKADDDSKDRKFGRAEHCYILEGKEEFQKRFLISGSCAAIIKRGGMPCSNGGKYFDGKSWWCGLHKTDNAEEPQDYINADEMVRIEQVSESIHRHPCVSVLKSSGWSEVSVYFEMFGLPCKARLDRWSEDLRLIIDLKKMDRKDLTLLNCQSEAAKWDYFLQAAFYIRAIESVLGKSPRFMFIFAESHPPFCAIPTQICHNTLPQELNVANGWIDYLLEEWGDCLSKNKFRGPWDHGKPALLRAPEWYLKNVAPERETI